MLPPPVPNRSKLRSVLTSPYEVGMNERSPRLDWRALKIQAPSSPQPGLPGQKITQLLANLDFGFGHGTWY